MKPYVTVIRAEEFTVNKIHVLDLYYNGSVNKKSYLQVVIMVHSKNNKCLMFLL